MKSSLPSKALAAAAMLALSLAPAAARAEIKSQPVEYKQGDTTLKGVLVFDDAAQGARPGVVVFPEWWGLDAYPKHRAEELAKLGYVAFAADMYGDGKVTDDPKEAGQLAGAAKKDLDVFRARAKAAYDQLANDPHADKTKIAAIGYCFGGACALELAQTGADLAAVVAFHGDLSVPRPADAKNIKAKVLACTGADDAFVPAAAVEKFASAMKDAGIDYEIATYGGARHAFTNPKADEHHMENVKYNKAADVRSWAAMRELFDETIGAGTK